MSKRKYTLQEELITIKKAQAGDHNARAEIISHYLKLVQSIANQYNTSSETMEDLKQEGNIGLMIALEKFDAHRGVKFSTYATRWIRSSMQHYFEQFGRPIRLPRNIELHIKKAHKIFISLSQDLTRTPTTEEIANVMNINTDKLNRILYMHSYSSDITSMFDNDNFDINTISSDKTLSADEFLERKTEIEIIQNAMKLLTDLQRKIITYRFRPVAKELSIHKIAELLNLSDSVVRNELKNAFEILRTCTKKDIEK